MSYLFDLVEDEFWFRQTRSYFYYNNVNTYVNDSADIIFIKLREHVQRKGAELQERECSLGAKELELQKRERTIRAKELELELKLKILARAAAKEESEDDDEFSLV